jgi:hypothetical protein
LRARDLASCPSTWLEAQLRADKLSGGGFA